MRTPRRALPRLLVVLAALLALGPLQGATAASATAHELVAGPVVTSTVSVARMARHVPMPSPSSHLHVVLWIGAAAVLLLPCLVAFGWAPARGIARTHLLPSAGRAPPVSS